MLSSDKPRGRASAGKSAPAPGAKSAIVRGQILDAAAQLFRDQGYSATTLRQIADAAGMQAGSIYYHFAAKDEILDEVLEIGETAVIDSVRAALAALPPEAGHRERIESAIRGHLDALLAKSVYSSANIRVFGQLPDDIKRRHRKRRGEYAKLWDGLFARAREVGAIRSNLTVVPLRTFVLGALNWTVEWLDAEHHSVEAIARRVSLLIFEGIESDTARKRRTD